MADKEYSEMQLSGLLAWVHRIVMFITLPFRKFWITLIVVLSVLAVLVTIPLCYGVHFQDIWSWYKDKLPFHQIISLKDKAVDKISDKVQKVGQAVGIKSDKSSQNKDKKYAVWNIKEFNQGKTKSEGKIPPQAGQLVVVKDHGASDNKNTVTSSETATQKKIVPEYHPYVKKAKDKQKDVAEDAAKPATRDLSSYYEVVKNQQLEYLRRPKVYQGSATVVGSNSLYVDDMFVYLYGVYSDPKIHDLVQAQDYLVALTEQKNVECHVVAYTVQTQTATALCFVDDVFLNGALVDKYLAGNVALKR